jgi:hypothetical protein
MTTTRIAVILLALATATTPALARHYYRHWHGNYNYGGPHYAVSDYYHNSRQLVGTR